MFYHASSRVEYSAKRHGRMATIMLVGLILCVEMPVRWLHATVSRSPREGWLVVRGMALFWRNLPQAFESNSGTLNELFDPVIEPIYAEGTE